MADSKKYRNYILEQDNLGDGMFAVIPTYSIYPPDKDEPIAKRVSRNNAEIFIDAHKKSTHNGGLNDD